jgi:putative transposase
MRRVQSRYAQYYNAHNHRNGHLWQNRFFSCMLAPSHLWTAIAYVERNPVRARIVRRAEDYRWSSAVAHVTGGDGPALLDMDWWRRSNRRDWREVLNRKPPQTTNHQPQEDDSVVQLRACTYAERPFGDEWFQVEIAQQLGCHWQRGRPSKMSTLKPHERAAQFSLFPPPNS